ncbi:hypothetical protein CA85_01550 [Allorhodopirellula solitaria]|uniref:Uncharacterized protein n=1 Tax=Allorhodopirellula solitaria TaxID=2527987 RepID=A0A5C5YJ33_9BACT|nr:hypothetical protein CA85_01550 [Allorhodopirellula solitaria]
MRKLTSYYLFNLSAPTRYVDSSGKTPEDPETTPQDDGCTNTERQLIDRAKREAKNRLARNPDCFKRMRNASQECSSQLHDCVTQGLDRSVFRCGHIGQGECHEERPLPKGVTATPCAKLKSDAANGDVYPEPDRGGDPKKCEPCEHPEDFANNCKLCPADGGYGTLETWICRSGRGNTIESDVEALTQLLVHEVSHNCVGGHDTTDIQSPGGKQDECKRPDAGSVEDTFKNCR